MSNPLDDYSGDPLTATETKKMRKLLHDKEVNDKLFSIVLLWSGYFAAFVAAVYAVRDHIAKVFKALTS